ncbi:hypothetical protein H6F89_29630 [Cyanobacteria bacterium FACHB-63]|nr:hypothetical protein [Cyanobacteria bacterium FACHB-63]
MSSPKVMVGCRVNPEIKAQIEQLAAASDIQPSAVIHSAIVQYLGIGSGDDPLSRIARLEQEVSQLKRLK